MATLRPPDEPDETPPTTTTEVPAFLLVGPLHLIWGVHDPEFGLVDAGLRWRAAAEAFDSDRGLDVWSRDALTSGPAYGVRFGLSEGREGFVDERLAAAGVTRDDIPRLRAEARRALQDARDHPRPKIAYKDRRRTT